MKKIVTILLLCCCGWVSAQHFPYHVSVQTVPGHCYDDTHLIFTLTDESGNEVQIDPQTHNVVNTSTAQFPLYNVQFHYQNEASGGVQYDYNNDVMLMAGTYCVGVTAEIPTQGGFASVDTTICNVQITTLYNYLETNALSNISHDDYDTVERYGFRASFHCADVGRIQLRIVQGSFPYTVTILDEQQDTVRHTVFYHRANNGNNPYAANYRDYYTFDSLAIGTYSIYVSDSCGYTVPLTFSIPDYEPIRYLGLVESELSGCLDETVVPFRVERRYPTGISAQWCNYNYSYLDSILLYRFVNPGGVTTEWKNLYSPGNAATWVLVYDTFPSYCDIFYDTIKLQLHDLCHDTLMTYSFRFLPQFGFSDSINVAYQQDTIIHDTCATYLPNGISTQMYNIWGSTWTGGGKTIYGSAYGAYPVPFRYYRCPLSYNIWSLPDSTLLGHAQSDEFTGMGTWETYFVDTSLHVYVSVTDAQGCTLADKDTVLVYQTTPVDELLFWFECHNDKDDDGKDHCCADRYLWIQEHGVDADTFRRNMTLRLIESPLYNQFNFTAIRQNGVWTVTPDDPNNHSTYLEFSYEDGWRATVRDSVCLPPGRYTFEVSTDCGVDTITYSWAGYYYDTLYYVSAPQYEMQQLCGDVVFTQISTGIENYMYFIDPEVSNDIPEVTIPDYACSSYSSQGGSSYKNSQGRNVLVFSIPGNYVITTYAYNWPYSNCTGWCSDYQYHYDTLTVAFSHLDFDMASAFLCDPLSSTGIVSAQAINGNAPYTYTLYDQWGASGNVIASNSSGQFDNVPMTMGQHLSVMVTDSCFTSFYVNVTATLLTHGDLLWELGDSSAIHCPGDTIHLAALSFPSPATYQWTGPNGFSSTSQTNDIVLNNEGGWYKVDILNSSCGSLITDSIYVPVASLPVTITGDSVVCSGGTATLQAVSPVSGLTYLWSTGDTSQSVTISSAGFYHVTATSSTGCQMADTFKVISVRVNGISNINIPDICAGDSVYITEGNDATCNVTFATHETILALHDTVFLPDGVPCDPYGCSYQSSLTFAGYADTAKVNSVNDIRYVRLNLEHSWSEDLYINLTCPNGQKADILKKGGDYAYSVCNDSIPFSSFGWEETGGDNALGWTFFGLANDSWSTNPDYACDASYSSNAPGIGWNYCWSDNTAEGYTYAPGDGLIYREDNVIYAYVPSMISEWEVFDSSDVVAGTQFYHPDESFANLIGCPLNGSWYIEVMDGSRVDNGYIFGWELALAEDIQTIEYTDVVNTIVEGPWVTATSDSSFLLTPPADLPNDTVVSYILHCYSHFGCGFDTTVSITFHARNHVIIDTTACDSLVWNESTYYASFTYSDTLTNLFGCDSIVTTHLLINYSNSSEDTITICDSIVWNDSTYYESGIYSVILTNTDGCDSVVTLHLTITHSDSTEEVVSICDSIVWNDSTYYESGIYSTTLTNADNCDSVATLLLTITHSDSTEEIVTMCDSIVWNDSTYYESGVYSVTLTNVDNCDSVATLLLTITHSDSTEEIVTMCDSIVWNDSTYYESGVYSVTLTNADNCDSVATLYLTITHATIGDTIAVACESFCWHDSTYTQSGDYSFLTSNMAGCDSVVTLHLTLHYATANDTSATACESFVWHDSTYYESGIYTDTLTNAMGCDSVVFLNLTINHSTTGDTNVVACENFTWHGITYTHSGDYILYTTNVMGCDSAVTLHLTIKTAETTEETLSSCDSIIWNGSTYYESGIYSITLLNNAGCDSVVTGHLTIHHGNTADTSASACDSFLWYDSTYYETGDYTLTLENTVGCDSVVTLHLTIKNSNFNEESIVGCDSVIWNDSTYYESGDYTVILPNLDNCDSIVTLHLTLHSTYRTETEEDACGEFEWNGSIYYESGVYIDTLLSHEDCDSIVTLSLTIHQPTFSEDNIHICEGQLPYAFGDTVIGIGAPSESVFQVHYNTIYGCDSIVTVHLFVHPSLDVQIQGPPVICADSFATLSVNAQGSYLWNTGESTSSINIYIPGIYSVTVTDTNGCAGSASQQMSTVTVKPIESVNIPDMCAGNSYPITIGHESSSSIIISNPVTTLSMADTIFLPDGVACDPYGCSYQSPLIFTDFAPNATISSVNDILYVRLNLEHSYSGDLYINLTCPNGQKADILKYNGGGTSNCTSQIPQSSRYWQTGNNASPATTFGIAYDPLWGSDVDKCDATLAFNAPGTGWNYCWSNNSTEGYIYASGAGSLIYRSGNQHNGRFDSSNVANGTKFYHPDQSFSNLVGCPLNGPWFIEVLDGYSQDNGYLFGWELALAPHLIPNDHSEVTYVTMTGPWVVRTSDTAFIVSPPNDLSHDTVVTYLFHMQDQYGCGYDSLVEVHIFVPNNIVIDTTVCDHFIWNGVTYTESDDLVFSYTNIHGCDSTITIHLTVYPIPVVTVSGLPVPCVDTIVQLTAVCVDSLANILWSTGDTTPSITVTVSDEYGITASNQGGCQYDTLISVSFTQPSQTIFDTTVCDLFVWNDSTYTQSGTYEQTFSNQQNCDSVVTIHLTVNQSYTTTDTLYLLQNQLPYYFAVADTTFLPNSPVEFQFTYTLSSQQHCDSVITQTVIIYHNTSQTVDTTVCATSLPLVWHGHTFSAADAVTDTLQSSQGTDSLITYELSVDAITAALGSQTDVLCFGESTGAATVNVSGGVSPLTYQWTNLAGATVSTTTQLSAQPAGSYTFTATDLLGCQAVVAVTLVAQTTEMLPGTIEDNQDVCIGDFAAPIIGTEASGGDNSTYQWQISDNGTDWTAAPGINNTKDYNYPDAPVQSFSLRRAWISQNCGTTYSNTLTINVWTSYRDTIADQICQNSPYEDNGFEISTDETAEIGLFTFENILSTGHCDSIIVLQLSIYPHYEAFFDEEVCEGDGYFEHGFSISPAETVGADTIQRTLNLQSAYGCDSVVTLQITVIDTAIHIVSSNPDFCETMSTELTIITEMNDYEWNTGEQTSQITVTTPGIYSVTASHNDCSVSANITVESCEFPLLLPNAITPSRGDGLNDYFCIPEFYQKEINLFEINIFNRWGTKVYSSTDKGFKWNGAVNGQIPYGNVYNYVIRYTKSNGKPYIVKGSVTVL